MPPISRQSHNLEVGEQFEGKYEIVRELGSGGFGMVYLAYQQAMDRHVAIKVLKSNLDQQRAAEAKERFLREVKVISRLRHPHTVTIHDFGESTNHDLLYMVLEFVDGEPLNDILETEGAQTPVRAMTLTTQIARSLSEAHNHGVVHRDLKPANIMVTQLEGEGDFVKVLDFGIARLLARSDRDLTRASLDDDDGDKIIGTPRYMSPEQVRGDEVDARSDVYCLGLLLYEMLVGEPAVRGDTTMALITQQVSPDPLELPKLNAFPESVARILRRATAKTPSNRYAGADGLIKDLQKALRHDYAGDSSGRVARAGSSSSGPLTAPDSAQQRADAPPGSRTTDDWQSDDAGLELQSATNAERNERRNENGGLYEPDDLEETGDRFAGAPAPSLDQDPFDGENSDPEKRDPPTDQPNQNQKRPPPDRPAPSPQPDHTRRSVGWFGLSLSILLAVAGVYVAFVTIGALLGTFLEGSTRLLAALAVATILPVFGALMGSPPDRQRFDKRAPATTVWSRRLSSIGILCVGTALLAFIALPDRVVPRLYTDANWFLPSSEATTVTDLNQRTSRALSSGAGATLQAVGLFDGTDRSSNRTVPSRPAEASARHRPRAAPDSTVPDADTDTDTGTDASNEPSTPPDKPTDDQDDDQDDQYEEW